MLQRLSEVAYNSYRAYLRRRRDPVRELFGESVPVALEEPRRAGLVVQRATAAVVTAAIVGGAIWGGGAMLEDRQDEDAWLDQRYWNAAARADALEDAYAAVYAEEMRDRGVPEERIGVAQKLALDELQGTSDDDAARYRIAPRDPATLAIGHQLEGAHNAREEWWDQMFSHQAR